MALGSFKFVLSGILIFAFLHVNTRITSKEDVSLNLPIYHPELDQFVEEFDALANEMFTTSKSPGAAITIVKNGRIIYENGFGVKKVNTQDSIDVHSTFRIASISKTFAGVLAGKMVDEGKLNWEDSVQEYFSAFELLNTDYARQMQVKHILSQSTGLIQHAYTNYIEEGMERDAMIEALSGVKLVAEPGKWFSYQNVAFGIIEPVLECATGYDYNSLMQKEIFEPLGMQDASMDYESMIENTNATYPNYPRRGGWSTGRISKTYYNVPSAGGINASISDMSKYIIALTGHRTDVISQNVLDEIFEPKVRTRIRWKYFTRWKDYEQSHYGLGWRIVQNNGSTIAYHGGYVNGYRSQLAVDIDDDIGIAILTNSPSSFSSKLTPAFLRLFDDYKDRLQNEEQNQIKLRQPYLTAK